MFFVEAVASDACICYTTTMIDTVPRYVFMTLLCLPVVLACAFLFDKLLVEVLEIHREKRARLERRQAERRRKELFDIEYQKWRRGSYR